MKIDIENKILIPFMVLIILSILVIMAMSYVNSYNMILENETKNYLYDLNEMIVFMEEINEGYTEDQTEAQNYIVEFYSKAKKNGLIIFNNVNREILLNNSGFGSDLIYNLMNKELKPDEKMVSEGDYIFIYNIYDRYDWTIGYRINKKTFFYNVLENEKNMILIAIVALVFSMQSAILISYNISKPIKKLAEYCDKIADGDSTQERIEINRKDEIGTLSNAFNNMLHRLQKNTEKIIEITRLNEDILKNIPAGIITTDRYGNLLSVNESAKKLMHENTEKNLDVDIIEKLLAQAESTLETNKVINNVVAFDNTDGSTIYLDVTTSILKGAESSKDGAICSFNDISDRKKFEDNMDLLDRLTSIGQFAAGIAHEVRNPLTGMKTSIQVLENRLCKSDDFSNKKLFNGIVHEIDRINDLISGLLNFAKPRVPQYEKTDLREVLDATLELVKKPAMDNKIDIRVRSYCENTVVFADKTQIEQIFLNIIKNSISAIDNQGFISVSFSNSCNESGSFVEVEFYDNGCGIHTEDMVKIFDPFFTTRNQGTGLGLSVVYELIKNNRGKIAVQSVVNEGTRVKVEFPVWR